MNLDDIQTLCERENTQGLCFESVCCDCLQDVKVLIVVANDGKVTVTGGALCDMGRNLIPKEFLFKCDECYTKDKYFGRKTEIYSRVVGYLRPISQWNKGKQAEFKARKNFDAEKAIKEMK